MVKVTSGGKTVITKARDLSMSGLSLYDVEAVDEGAATLSIPLPRDREVVSDCRVVRRGLDGVAVEFGDLQWEDLFALARYLHPRLP